MEKGYSIEVRSDFKDWWRYNVIIMCGGFEPGGERRYVVSIDDSIAEVGSDIEQRPDTYPSERITRLDADDCPRIAVYIYIIPHSLPLGRDVEKSKPFDVHLSVKHNGADALERICSINQWSGASIELNIPQQE